MKLSFLLIIFFFFIFSAQATENLSLTEKELTVLIEFKETSPILILVVAQENSPVKFKRGKAILFTVFTGLFGGHRIYFGTHHRTPIIYSITLGGLGILPLVDLINIIFTKDLSKFDNKTQIIMWGN
jgi:hypothetical protein